MNKKIYLILLTIFVTIFCVSCGKKKNNDDFSNQNTPDNSDTIFESTSKDIEIIRTSGYEEGIYVEWKKVENSTSYNVYYKTENSQYIKIDDNLIREYDEYNRADILGLKSGKYQIKIEAVGTTKTNEVLNLNVTNHDRSGFAFVNGTSSGAYNDDGSLKDNAVVLYITENSKNTVSLEVTGASENPCVGLQNILTGFKKKKDNRPLCVRFIGNITDLEKMEAGDILIDSISNGVTFEGVGEDATLNGFGLRIKGSSNVEVRNLGFMNCNSNEGDNIGLQQDNDHVWVHNCDLFYGDAGSDADQAKGDGALDTKTSTFVTHSYNHFFDTGKSNLQGMKQETEENYITYHHNWYDHSDSRHPRIRTCSVHVYNNYFDGNSKYGVGVTMGASAFVEGNYFRDCKYPMLSSLQGTDALGAGTFSGEEGGIIKAYKNHIEGASSYLPYTKSSGSDFDAYEVNNKNDVIPDTIKTLSGLHTYNNFDTSSIMYEYDVQTPQEAVKTIKNKAGRLNGGDISFEFDETEDENSLVIPQLKELLLNYNSKIISIQNDTVVILDTHITVIEAINLLPNVTDLKTSDYSKVYEALDIYNGLNEEEKTLVTNYTKLLELLNEMNSGTQQTTFEESYEGSNPFFTIVGSLKSNPAPVTYNGVTYNHALKMESSTSITFNISRSSTLIIVTDSPLKNVKVGEKKYSTDENGVLTLNISDVGTYVISKGDSLNVYTIIVS